VPATSVLPRARRVARPAWPCSVFPSCWPTVAERLLPNLILVWPPQRLSSLLGIVEVGLADVQQKVDDRQDRRIDRGNKREGEDPGMKKATFGAGCFWGVESAFRQVQGVVDAAVGYLGGTLENPTYQDVCTGTTGHAEVVEVTYDPEKVSYDQLLDLFWKIHDPTTLNRQGPDFGTQYRSAIFYHDEAQRDAALASRERLRESGRFRRPIVTEVTPASPFYRAEEYHQRYLEKRGRTSCHL